MFKFLKGSGSQKNLPHEEMPKGKESTIDEIVLLLESMEGSFKISRVTNLVDKFIDIASRITEGKEDRILITVDLPGNPDAQVNIPHSKVMLQRYKDEYSEDEYKNQYIAQEVISRPNNSMIKDKHNKVKFYLYKSNHFWGFETIREAILFIEGYQCENNKG